MIKRISIAAICLLCAAFAFGQSAQTGMPVTVEPVKILPLDAVVRAIGEVKSSQDVKLASQFGGRIMELDIQLGDSLEKNTLVARLRSKEAEILARSAGAAVNDIQIISPISGFVVQKYVSVGDIVAAGQPIARIVSANKSYLSLHLPSDYLGKVAVGSPVDFAVGSVQVKAKVSYVVPIVDPTTGTFRAIVELNRSDLFPGFYVDARILIHHKTAPAVPRSAVLTVDGKPVVFVIKDGKAAMREVQTGIETDSSIEVVNGLSVGELVAVSGNYELSDGTAVTVLNASAK